MTNTIKKGLVFALALMMMIVACSCGLPPAYADGGSSVTAQCKDGDTPLSGVTVYMYKVATVDAAGSATVTADFAAAGLTFPIDGNAMHMAAVEKLDTYVKSNTALKKSTVKTDTAGKAALGSGLERGLYFITADPLKTSKYTYQFESALIEVPSFDSVNKKPVYDVVVVMKYQKTAVPAQTPTPQSGIKTGDETNIMWYGAAFAICACMTVSGFVLVRRKKDKEEGQG